MLFARAARPITCGSVTCKRISCTVVLLRTRSPLQSARRAGQVKIYEGMYQVRYIGPRPGKVVSWVNEGRCAVATSGLGILHFGSRSGRAFDDDEPVRAKSA